MPRPLDEVSRRYRQPEKPVWKLLLRLLVFILGALAVAYLAYAVRFNPFHLKNLNW